MSSRIWVNKIPEVQEVNSLQNRCRDYKKKSKANYRKATTNTNIG